MFRSSSNSSQRVLAALDPTRVLDKSCSVIPCLRFTVHQPRPGLGGEVEGGWLGEQSDGLDGWINGVVLAAQRDLELLVGAELGSSDCCFV